MLLDADLLIKIKSPIIMKSLFKSLKIKEKFASKIPILKNPICQLSGILLMILYFLQLANNNRSFKTQHYQLSNQFLRDTTEPFLHTARLVQEKPIRCRVDKVNHKVSFREQSGMCSKRFKEPLIQRNIWCVQHFYNFIMRSW